MMPSRSAMNCAADAAGRFDHLAVIERLRQHARGHIRDARNPEHLHPHLAGDDGFGHRRHADRVGADRAQIPDLRRRLVARDRAAPT